MTSYSVANSILLKKAQYYSVATAIIICIIKSYTWVETGSVSVFASLADSLMDVTSSIINMLALKLAMTPPDHNHRFGHNKIEDLAVFGQSIFITLSGFFALYAAWRNLASIEKIADQTMGIYAMIICSLLTSILVIYQEYVINKTKSSIIKADRLHYMSDLLTNIAVIVSLYFSNKISYIDSVFGMIIASYVIFGSYHLFICSIKNLVDEEFSDDERKKIIDIISKHSEIYGVHEMKTRYAGNKPFIQFHLEMDGDMKLSDAHIISDKIVDEILQQFKGAEIIIHQDPAGVEYDKPYTEVLINR